MKRTPALPLAALAVAITFGAAACGDNSPNASNGSDTTAAADSTEASDTTEAPDTTEASDTTEAAETTEAGDDTTEAPDGTADLPEAVQEPTVETAAPVLVGLTEDEATEAAEEAGWEVRVIRRDGEDLPMTLDFRPNRVNVEVTDGEVTDVLQIG